MCSDSKSRKPVKLPVATRDNPVRHYMEENLELVDTARQNSPDGLVHQLFPNSATKLTRQSLDKELALGFDYRRQALKLAVDSKLQAVQEACNHVLVTGKSEIRRERQEFFADQVSRLSMAMHCYAEEFNTEIDNRLQELPTRYKSELIRKKEEQRLIRQIEDFHEVLESMASEFQQIIHEGVHTDQALTDGSPAR